VPAPAISHTFETTFILILILTLFPLPSWSITSMVVSTSAHSCRRALFIAKQTGGCGFEPWVTLFVQGSKRSVPNDGIHTLCV
jgi:hypothetical protein